MLSTTTNLTEFLSWFAAIALAFAFLAVVLCGTRFAFRRLREDTDPLLWVLFASFAGGSASTLVLVLV